MDDNNTAHQSPDDALEPDSGQDGMFHPGTDEERLEEDNGTPAGPADDTSSMPIPPDHPSTDTHLDEHEVYDEGIADAAQDNREDENPTDDPQRLE